MTLIKSISGIRGIVNSGFDESIITQYAIAFSKIQPEGVILIARDGRKHGLQFSKKLSEILISLSRDVVDCGIIPTPTAQFIVKENNYSGGIIITASHNPSEWNGLKFIDIDGCFLSPQKNIKLLSSPIEKYNKLSTNRKKIDYNSQSISQHIKNIIGLSYIDIEKIRNKKYKIVVDAVNSSGSKIIPELLKEMGCEVITINCNSDGTFSRGAEPLAHNLTELSESVLKTNSNLGIATDPDGDRLAIVDEKGNPLGEEFTLVVCCDSILKQHTIKNPIVTNLSTSMAIDKLADKYNVKVKRTKVGEINVVDKMKIENSIVGGEGNGGVILSESHYGRDSLVAISLFLNRLSMERITVSELYNKLPHYEIVKDFIKTEDNLNQNFINTIKQKFNPNQIDELDGVKLIWPDKWIHIRKSNTEPIVRFYAESENLEDSKILITKSKELFTN